MRSSEYRRLARESLAGNWGSAILAALIAGFFGGLVCNSFSINIDSDDLKNINFMSPEIKQLLYTLFAGGTVLNLVHLILGGVVRLGHCTYVLKQYDRKEPAINDLFSHFDIFGSGLCLSLLTSIYTALWSLLLIVPGIIASYSYSMAPFIMAENPQLTASQAIARSKKNDGWLQTGALAVGYVLHRLGLAVRADLRDRQHILKSLHVGSPRGILPFPAPY